FFRRTRARYLELAESDPRIVTVDASQSIDNVHQSIRTAVLNWLAQQEEA
ncbi:TPA: dTMP kinase, partial [Klebsiella pneumoniae]|nr:dTMP kinase [Klebsiella pneumoniae]